MILNISNKASVHVKAKRDVYTSSGSIREVFTNPRWKCAPKYKPRAQESKFSDNAWLVNVLKHTLMWIFF